MAKNSLRSRIQYTLLNPTKSKFNLYTVMSIGVTGIAIIVIIVLAVLAAHSHSSGPNVALFNLTAAVTPPSGETLKFVYLGYGTQNYTCNATSGTYSTTGTAQAELLDVTNYYTGKTPPASLPPIQGLNVAGTHYFTPNPLAPGVILPKFQNNDGFVIATKNNSIPNVIPTFSVATVLLQNIQPGEAGGSLADWVVRTNVVGGVVPTLLDSCHVGEEIAIPYKANYLFFSKT